MNTITVDPIARYRILHDLGLRPGSFHPARALVTAKDKARAAGLENDYLATLYPRERRYITEFEQRPNARTPWLYIDGMSAAAYAIATDADLPVYTPPPIWREPLGAILPIVVNPLRIRGGAVEIIKPAGTVRTSPRIVGLLPAVCLTPDKPSNRIESDYWHAMEVLESTGARTRES